MPGNPDLVWFQEEKCLKTAYRETLKAKEIFLKQKSRVQWLDSGNKNNNRFFQACRGKWNSKKIFSKMMKQESFTLLIEKSFL